MCYSIILQTHPRPLLSVSNLQSRKLSQHVSENVFIHFLLAVYSVLFQLWAFVCIFYLVSLPCLKYSIVSLHFFRFFLRSPRSPFFLNVLLCFITSARSKFSSHPLFLFYNEHSIDSQRFC